MSEKISYKSLMSYIKKQDWKKILRQSIMVFLSAFILAVAVELFIANFGLVSGGVTGISITLEHICNRALP